ncbi:MAG TPA: right-handed parallel beta-helix repeat-containing protein [Geminicoccaceae bacterium]|nr:right-handed parallel beta-helix repeat-containing protein [Geminicoccaceae bacterium]
MVDRTPQEFGGVPDGVTDSTAAIQAAIDAAGASGDDVLIAGGIFRTSGQLNCPHGALRIKGDGGIQALSGAWPSQAAILAITGSGVVVDGDGLLLDQANVIPEGYSLRGTGAVGLTMSGLISRNSQGAFLLLDDGCTDVLVHDIHHRGSGYGILAADPQSLARIEIRDSDFEHAGTGPTGDGIQLNCATHGGDDVEVTGVTVRGYIGESVGHGSGFGFAGVTNTRLFGCIAELCESDGFRWQQQSNDTVAFNCRALNCGRPDHVNDCGSGFIVYDSSRWHGESLLAVGCWYHGIALSGQNSVSHPADNVIVRCSALDIGRDCFHFTAQARAVITRCHARDPSRSSDGGYAAYHLARQGGATLENVDCTGDSNTVISTGATTPLGDTVVRPESVNCLVNGISGGTAVARVTEDGAIRLTESGEERLLEAA